MKALPLLILIVFVLSACSTSSNLPSGVSIPSQATSISNSADCEEARNMIVGFSSDGALVYSADCYQVSGSLATFRTKMTESMIRADYTFTASQRATENGVTVTVEGWEKNSQSGKILMYLDVYFIIADVTF